MKLRTRIRLILDKILPDKMCMKLYYAYIYKRNLRLDKPIKFSEKIWWLKKYYGEYQKEILQLCYDKYTVREYVKEKVGEKYLNELYSVYDNADEIDFDKLPNEFVIKVSQSWGKNFICPNKDIIDRAQVIEMLRSWLEEMRTTNPFGIEGYVLNGKAVLISEKFLKDKEGKIPEDYRFYCFNGKPEYIIYDIETTKENGSHGENIKRNVYDKDWNFIDVKMGRENCKEAIIDKPSNLNEMLYVAEKLSEDFPFVRVDLYNVDGNIIFGELTWIPMGGNCVITPKSFDYELGKLLNLPNVKLNFKEKE